jgi:hypothetical protein
MNLEGGWIPHLTSICFSLSVPRPKMDCIMPLNNKSWLGKSMGVRWRRLRRKDQHIPVAYGSTFFLFLPLKKNRTILFEFIGKLNRSASLDFK